MLKHHIGETVERAGHRVTWSPDLVQKNPRSSVQQRQSISAARFGGPPVRGLTIDAETTPSFGQGQSIGWQNTSVTTTLGSPRKEQNETNYSFVDVQQKSFINSSQIDPFYTQG